MAAKRSSVERVALHLKAFVGTMTSRQPVRFLIAGSVATAVNWASRFPLSLVLSFEAALAGAYGIGLLIGFLAYRHWVFRGSQLQIRHQALRFLLVNAVGLAIVIGGTRGFLSLLSTSFLPLRWAEATAHGLALVLASVANFIGHRGLSFTRRLTGGPATTDRSPKMRLQKDGSAPIQAPGGSGIACAAIFGAVLAHRALLWWLHGDDVVRTIRGNPNWLTLQFLPLQAYADHLRIALLYLQQTPPLPHAVFGVLVKLFAWPLGVAEALFVLQALISATTTALLFVLLYRIGCYWVVSLQLALWFGLSSDLYLMEINSFGQLFYESGGMLFVTATAVLLCATPPSHPNWHVSGRSIACAGLAAALAALTRASLSFLAVPLAVAVAVRCGRRAVLLFVVPVIGLQGVWCLKNTLIYRHPTIAVSSWSGINAANGINVMNGYGTSDAYDPDPFIQTILQNPGRYPAWLSRVLEERGYVDWDSTFLSEFMPQDIRDADDAIQHRMGGTNPFPNSIAIAELSREYSRTVLAYMAANPLKTVKKIWLGNLILWQPIADYSSMFMGPLYVQGQKRDLLTGPYVYRPTAAYAKIGPDGAPTLISLPALPLYLLDTVSIIVFAILLPFTIACDVAARCAGRTPLLGGSLWLLIVVAGYGLAVSTSVDLGENMRFRLSFEPVIIAVTAGNVTVLCALVQQIWVRLVQQVTGKSIL